MIIPLGTELTLPRRPIVTQLLVFACVAVHLAMYALDRTNPEQARQVLQFGWVQGGDGFHWWGLVTSAFLHGGWMHLAGNMVFLWVFGPSVESRFGRFGFLGFYLAGAAVSGGAHALLESSPAVGASGAIAAVTGSFIVSFPQTRVKVLWLIGFVVMQAPAWWVIGLGVLWSLFATGLGVDSGVAHIAHLAGYVWGIGLTMLLIGVHVFPRQPYDLFTALRQAKRRRDLRSAAETARSPARVAARLEPMDPRANAIALARAEVSVLVESQNLDEAAATYTTMMTKYDDASVALRTMPRQTQYAIATHLYGAGQFGEAVDAFSLLLEVYPGDAEADQIRVLMARALVRHLGRPAEAAGLLDQVIESGRTDEVQKLAERERAQIASPQNSA